jgi:hypothetical protein
MLGTLGFWGQAGATLTPYNTAITDLDTFVTDPWVIYDTHANRFIIIALRIVGITNGSVLLAVSTNSTPTTLTSTSWYFYQIDRTQVGPTFPDFVKCGYNNTNYYFSEANFDIITDAFVNLKVFAVAKVNVLSGAPLLLASVIDDLVVTVSGGFISQTRNDDTSNTIVLTQTLTNTQIRLWYISDVSPSSANTLVTVNFYNNMPIAYQPDLTLTLNAGDSRFVRNIIRNNHLWACHAITDGVIIDSNGNLKALGRWYEINLGTWPSSGLPSILQQQTINPVGDDVIIYPMIDIDTNDNMVLGFSLCGATRFPAIGICGRLFNDTPSTTRPIVVVHNSASIYDLTTFAFLPPFRWGDYSGLYFDPTVSGRFWIYNMYVGLINSWSSSVIRVDIDSTLAPLMSLDVPEAAESDEPKVVEIFDIRESNEFVMTKSRSKLSFIKHS